MPAGQKNVWKKQQPTQPYKAIWTGFFGKGIANPDKKYESLLLV
jgi:hypothetical protein